ncbi:DUF4245 domain-containing protein [Leucobacter luti]|uniref:Uncharacterized protein DUF4245 n=1 Tax=Leucobacter luti TaxID=340320 RepID=A0A4Q7U4D2_9MICO|nr:DUF4245 domain-containing protein [Leucobacter luti]MBL3700626.1 DUF4245 domain-containing protein [Leucobacter luti]RZT68535.1 uncharacterized protein DUF4245 [Leucobacter luti]
MAKKNTPPVVVAELGRPETPSETAARKAKDSRLYRQRKTVNNLVFSLIVTLGLVLVMYLAVPRGVGDFENRSVDVIELASDAAPSAGRTLAAPAVGDGWLAKQAQLRGSGSGVTSWQLNYTTADEAYAAVTQAFTADGTPVNDTWIAEQLEQQAPTGTEELGGVEWIVYDHTDRNPDESNMLFGLQGTWGTDTILVYGTDSPATIRVLATQVVESLGDPATQTPKESE